MNTHPPIAWIAGTALICSTAIAQEAPQPAYSSGEISVTPTIISGFSYSDNVRKIPAAVADLRNDTKFDIAATLISRPGLTLNLDTFMTRRSYRTYHSDEQTMKSLLVNGEIKVNTEWSIGSNFQRFDSEIDEGDPNSTPGSIKSKTDTKSGKVQLSYGSPTYYGQLSANVKRLAYSSSFLPDSGTAVSNGDQNRQHFDTDLYWGRMFNGNKLKSYLYLGYNEISYESSFSKTVAGRNSSGTKIGIGLEVSPAADLNASLLYGYLRQTYDSSLLGTESGIFGSASANLKINPANFLAMEFFRAFKESTIPGSTGFFADQISIQGQHHLSPEWSIDFAPTFTRTSVTNIEATIRRRSAQVGLNHNVKNGLILRAEIKASHQDANNNNFAAFRYDERVTSITGTYRF